MNIIVAGGMGYIGSSVVELYRNDPRHRLIVVDREFHPDRVAALPKNARYINADAFDIGFMKKLLAKADALFLLAAEVQAESSAERSDAVWEANFERPRKLIEACSTNTRILFSSSGNVFGGVDENVKFRDLTEEDEPCPKLPYAESKRALEQVLLKRRDDNYTIVRFGTNYGYSPGVRFNLVTNIFLRQALLGETLKVHGGGENFRPTCCVWDCARALKFLTESPNARGELFHVVSQSYRIRDLAESVVRYVGSSSKVEYIDKVVPFSAYALISDKIKSLGFAFEWDLERAVGHMAQMLDPMRMRASGDLWEV